MFHFLPCKPKLFIMSLILGYVAFFLIQLYVPFDLHFNQPTLVWWTPFMQESRLITCYKEKYKCLVTDKSQVESDLVYDAFLFYASNVNDDDLPKKVKPWAIYHEESPKNWNTFLDERVQNVFNIGATFSRYSELPLTLQYLKSSDELTSDEFYLDVTAKNELIRTNGLAPVLYIQSDCETPIERDKYVAELMKHIDVDSYGSCLNNKVLPERFKLNGSYELYEEDFMRFVAQYKFVISIENAICEDYITEKLWRPLIVGAIPIYLGSPTVQDWLPNVNSAILIDDYPTPKELADHIKRLDKNDALYEKHLTHKIDHRIENQLLSATLARGLFGIEGNQEDYVLPAFECFVCKSLHEKRVFNERTRSIYECTEPKADFWLEHWSEAKPNADKFLQDIS